MDPTGRDQASGDQASGDQAGAPGPAPDLDAARTRLQLLGVLARRTPAAPALKARIDRDAADNVRRFTRAEGLQILVGRDNKQNDRLTLRIANGNDVWMHVGGGRHGSHVVVRLPKGRTASLETLLDAGTLAVHFSKARSERLVEVVYTQAKHVRKPKGLPAGAVVPQHTRSLRIRLEDDRLRRLLDSAGDDQA
jgi:predicted ribosome quality control (RQC) complex YloA/Tae2 family protein